MTVVRDSSTLALYRKNGALCTRCCEPPSGLSYFSVIKLNDRGKFFEEIWRRVEHPTFCTQDYIFTDAITGTEEIYLSFNGGSYGGPGTGVYRYSMDGLSYNGFAGDVTLSKYSLKMGSDGVSIYCAGDGGATDHLKKYSWNGSSWTVVWTTTFNSQVTYVKDFVEVGDYIYTANALTYLATNRRWISKVDKSDGSIVAEGPTNGDIDLSSVAPVHIISHGGALWLIGTGSVYRFDYALDCETWYKSGTGENLYQVYNLPAGVNNVIVGTGVYCCGARTQRVAAGDSNYRTIAKCAMSSYYQEEAGAVKYLTPSWIYDTEGEIKNLYYQSAEGGEIIYACGDRYNHSVYGNTALWKLTNGSLSARHDFGQDSTSTDIDARNITRSSSDNYMYCVLYGNYDY